MKLLGRSKAPGHQLRQTVEASDGGIEMRVSALFQAYGFGTRTPSAADEVRRDLRRVGLVVEPSLEHLRWDDRVRVSMRVARPPVVEQPAVELTFEEAVDGAAELTQTQTEPQEETQTQEETHTQEETQAQEETQVDQAEVVAQTNGKPVEAPDEITTAAAAVIAAEEERRRALEERLQGLVASEQAARAQQQAEADQRIAEAQRVLVEAREESERERAHRASLERQLEEANSARASLSERVQAAQEELSSARADIDQKTSA